MSDELDIRAKVTLEADEAASVKQIKSQIPNIENGLKNTRVKVPVEADVSNTAQQVQQAVKTAASSLKTGKTIIPIDAAFNINLKDTNAVQAEVTRLIKQFTQNKGTLIDFKIKADGVNEANSVMLKYKNSAQETVSTMLKLVDVTQDVNNPQFAWQVNSNVFEKNIAKYEQGLSKITEAERKASGSYWQGQFKDAVSSMTSTNDELVKMSAYYSEMESSATKAAKAQESASKDYWQGRFKESVADITAENSALNDMADYYRQVSKEADLAAESANKLRILQQKSAGLKTDSAKSGFNLDWSLYDNAINTGNLKQAEVELGILNREFVNLGKAARASMPDNVLENLPLKINDAARAAAVLANNFKAISLQGGSVPGDVVSQVEALKSSLQQLQSAPVNQDTVSQFTKLGDELHTLENTYKTVVSNIRTDKIEIGAENVQVDLQKIRSNLVSMQKDWSAAMKNPAFVQRFKEMFAVIDSGTIKSGAQLTNFRKEVQRLSADIQAAGLDQKTFLGQIGDSFRKFVSWFAIGGFTASAVRGIRDVVTAVKDLNKAFTDLKIATNGSNKQVLSLLSSYTQMGKEIGATTTEISNAAADWLRQGKSIADTNTLIYDSMVLSKVGNIDAADATTYLTSAMKGYGVAVGDVLGIVDKLTSVDLVSATSAAGLASGMAEVANNANLAGINMDKLLGYLASIGEVTQDPMSEVGHSLSTMFSRMGNIKLARLKDYQNNGEDLSNVETVLRGLGVDLRDSVDSFRNFGDVLDEVAGKWDTYTEVEQRALATAFASKNNMEDFLVLMENYGKATEYAATASDSSGTAMAKMGAYSDSLEAKQKRLTASFEEFSSALLNSDLVGFSYDASSGVLGFLSSVISSLDAIPVLATAAAAALSFKNVGQPKCRAAVGLPRQILHKRCTFLDVGTTRFKIKREAPTFLLVSGLNCQEGLSSQYNLQPAFVPARYQRAMSVTDVMICAKEVQRL